MKLLRELVETVSYIEEANEGQKSFFITGPFMQSEVKNKNGRVYPRSVMEQAVSKYIGQKVNNKTSYGELSHPQGPKINEDRISHLIESLSWDGNDVIGKAKILNTPMGNIAKAIMEGGGRLGVSSRGLGSLKQNQKGIMEVQNDFFISTAADLVSDPSAPAAWVNSVMENIEWKLNESTGEWFQEMIHETKNEIKKQKLNEDRILKLFKDFVESI